MELSEIKQIRRKFSLTQGQLAKMSNVSQSLIAKIESNTIDPTYTKARRIIHAIELLEHKNVQRADTVMNASIIQANADDRITAAMKTMRRHQISQMPVMDNKTVVGILTETTLLDALARSPEKIEKLLVKDIMDEVPPTDLMVIGIPDVFDHSAA